MNTTTATRIETANRTMWKIVRISRRAQIIACLALLVAFGGYGATTTATTEALADGTVTAAELHTTTTEPAARWCDATHCWTSGKWHIEDGCNHTDAEITNGAAERAPDAFRAN